MGNMHGIDRLSLAAKIPLMPLPLFSFPSTTRLDSRRPQSSSDQNGGPVAVNESIANKGVGVGQPVPMLGRIQSQLSASLTATTAAELPCTVKLRIWYHDSNNPCASLNPE
ncbi:hypothetical protein Lser_V15G46193 [Lactuca serriola]